MDEHLLHRENGTKAAQELPLAEDVGRRLAGYDAGFSPPLADGAEAKLLEGRTTSAAATMSAAVALRLMMGVLAPTAAMPSSPPSPEKWPIMTTSMRLESCSRMLEDARGRHRQRKAGHGPPERALEDCRLVLHGNVGAFRGNLCLRTRYSPKRGPGQAALKPMQMHRTRLRVSVFDFLAQNPAWCESISG